MKRKGLGALGVWWVVASLECKRQGPEVRGAETERAVARYLGPDAGNRPQDSHNSGILTGLPCGRRTEGGLPPAGGPLLPYAVVFGELLPDRYEALKVAYGAQWHPRPFVGCDYVGVVQ